MCSGYYSYRSGYAPDFAGTDSFQGRIVHPQQWPEDLDYSGKKVVVIGSGATAVTLVPEMARTAGHVTMLQRSPTYVVSRPAEDGIANWLRTVLPPMVAYGITRWKNVLLGMLFFRMARNKPQQTKERIIAMVREKLGPDYDVETHFTPRYNPWDQRLCLVPDDDLFESIKAGSASVVTDEIETFTATGLKLKSGQTLEAEAGAEACGDIAVIEVTVDDGRITDAGFRVRGCGATTAAASAACEALRDATLDDALRVSAASLDADLGGLGAERRKNCGLLVFITGARGTLCLRTDT
jgi:cation diffusion facilitator CzcD-associated flavoprotein CzcO